MSVSFELWNFVLKFVATHFSEGFLTSYWWPSPQFSAQGSAHVSHLPSKLVKGLMWYKNNNYSIWEGLTGKAVVNSINMHYSLLHVLPQLFFSRDDIKTWLGPIKSQFVLIKVFICIFSPKVFNTVVETWMIQLYYWVLYLKNSIKMLKEYYNVWNSLNHFLVPWTSFS